MFIFSRAVSEERGDLYGYYDVRALLRLLDCLFDCGHVKKIFPISKSSSDFQTSKIKYVSGHSEQL